MFTRLFSRLAFLGTLGLLTSAGAQAADVPFYELESKPNQEVYWGGSEDVERSRFEAMGREIVEVITRQTEELRGQSTAQRAFHAKSHLCLRGHLIPDSDRPLSTRAGILAENAPAVKFWARFSSGEGWVQDDTEFDIRGLALKLLEVPGAKFMADESESQDLIMISSPTGFGADAVEFMNFAEANSQHAGILGQATTAWYALWHASVRDAVFRGVFSTFLGIDSLTHIQYWSGTPYRLGDNQVMKYSVKPEVCPQYASPGASPEVKDFEGAGGGARTKFRRDLRARAFNGFCMGLYVQRQSDDVKATPIEDASKEWTTPFVKVATLDFFPQPELVTDQETSQAVDRFCDRLSFNPWHAIAEHRPLGNQNRARRWVYDASRANRGGGGIGQSPFSDWNVK